MISLRRKRTATAEYPCSAEVLYEILTDYDLYSDWMPLVENSQLLAKAGELAIAQLGWAPPLKGHVTAECIHTTNAAVISRVIEGKAPLTSFDWELEPRGAERCSLKLTIGAALGLHSGFRELLDPARVLAALQTYAGSFSPQLVLDGERGEVILEVFETEQGLSCWFNGQKYEMKPVKGSEK